MRYKQYTRPGWRRHGLGGPKAEDQRPKVRQCRIRGDYRGQPVVVSEPQNVEGRRKKERRDRTARALTIGHQLCAIIHTP